MEQSEIERQLENVSVEQLVQEHMEHENKKYKRLGFIQTFYGFSQITSILVQIFFVMPKLDSLYQALPAGVQYTKPELYAGYIVGFLLGSGHLFFGLVNLGKLLPDKKEKLYKVGLIYLIITMALTVFALTRGTMSALNTVSSSLQI